MPAPDQPEMIAECALRYSALAPGHRWRPILFLALIEGLGRPPKDYLAAAAGLELLHSSTLIIDDLPFVDNAALRRGQACCHVRFGVDVAVYASHMGFDLALNLILRNASQQLAKDLCFRTRELKETLVAGQCLERALTSQQVHANKNMLHRQYVLKSGALFRFTTGLAARLTQNTLRSIKLLERFGENIGIAYQIADDLADLSGKPSRIGKKTSMDVGKANYPRSIGTAFAREMLSMHHRRSLTDLSQLFESGILTGNKSLITEIVNKIHCQA